MSHGAGLWGVAECLWAQRPGSMGEAPSHPAHREEGCQEGTLCRVAAPGSASRPFPTPGPSAHAGPRTWHFLSAGRWPRSVSSALPPPLQLPPSTSQPGRGRSLPRSPFWHLRRCWEGTHDSHVAPKVFWIRKTKQDPLQLLSHGDFCFQGGQAFRNNSP